MTTAPPTTLRQRHRLALGERPVGTGLASIRSMTTRSTPTRRDAARNQERILAAAREAFDEAGAEASFEEIAHRAGVGVATVFRRFPSRANLVEAVFEQVLTEAEPEVVAMTDDPWQDVVSSVRVSVEVLASHPALLRQVQEAGLIDISRLQNYVQAVDPLLRRAQEAGVIRTDLLARDLAAIIVMVLAVRHQGDPLRADGERYLALLLDGLAPGPTPLPPPAHDDPDAVIQPILDPTNHRPDDR